MPDFGITTPLLFLGAYLTTLASDVVCCCMKNHTGSSLDLNFYCCIFPATNVSKISRLSTKQFLMESLASVFCPGPGLKMPGFV